MLARREKRVFIFHTLYRRVGFFVREKDERRMKRSSGESGGEKVECSSVLEVLDLSVHHEAS